MKVTPTVWFGGSHPNTAPGMRSLCGRVWRWGGGEYFAQPYPARAALGVASLPKGALVEMDGVVIINS